MRARFVRPRQSIRGRLVAPVAAAAAVALVGGVVVASPDAPTHRGEVQSVALTAQSFNAGAEVSIQVSSLLAGTEWEGMTVTGVDDLPEGLTFDGAVISGVVETAGNYEFTVIGELNGNAEAVVTTIVINNADGTPPSAGGGSSAAAQGSLGGEAQAGGEITTGSDGGDAILSVVAGIVASLGGDAGSVTELATGSTGGGETTPENPEAPTGPLGSLATGQLDTGSLGQTTPENPDAPQNPAGSLSGSQGTVEGGTDLETGGEVQTGSTGGTDTETGGEITIPGSTADTGSLGTVAPGLAITGAGLLGLAGLSLLLSGGSSTPGATSSLPALPGSSGSSGAVAPTVAAGAPADNEETQAPGPTVANGRG